MVGTTGKRRKESMTETRSGYNGRFGLFAARESIEK
jgi:hypothetical protein